MASFSFPKAIRRLASILWGDYYLNNDLWQQIAKGTIACTIAVIISISPAPMTVLGTSAFLGPMATVFGHPGQRMGLVIQSILMILIGGLLGLGYALLGLYLSSLTIKQNPAAAYAIRAMFYLGGALFHGYIRSSSPRLFSFVVFFIFSCIIVLLGESSEVTLDLFTTIYYPILVGSAVSLAVNACILPELSSGFLGLSTIDTLSETMEALNRATYWFITPGGDQPASPGNVKAAADQSKRKKNRLQKFLDDFPNPFKTEQSRFRPTTIPIQQTTVAGLTARKAKLRSRLERCKAAQREVNYEFSISPLPPSSMKPLSTSQMSSLVQTSINLVGACENKFIVLKNDTQPTEDDVSLAQSLSSTPSTLERVSTVEDYLRRVENAKPRREIEASSAKLLESILKRIREPVQEFSAALQEAAMLVIACLAYCYDVRKLPSGAHAPRGIHLEELDLRIDVFTNALNRFDLDCANELSRSTMGGSGHGIDFMPRMETFLISSFVMAMRQAAESILQMLRHVRKVVEQRKSRGDRSSIWFPRHTSIRQWLTTGGESDGLVLPNAARKEVRRGKTVLDAKPKNRSSEENGEEHLDPKPNDEERVNGRVQFQEPFREKREDKKPTKKRKPALERGLLLTLRGKLADALEWLQDSDDLAYAIKLAIGLFAVSWPALVTSWNSWYTDVHGIWAPMQLMLVFEVAIGTSFFIFFLRLAGVTFGCVMGYLSHEIGRGNRVALVVILVCGIIPSSYIQLGTKYVKAGMMASVTMVVVSLATISGGESSAVENFYKRLAAFVIGGCVALLVEVAVFPVRARHRLLESLAASVKQVQNMQVAVSVGLDSPIKPDLRDPALHKRFNHARDKARAALTAANTFLPFCSTEPRLKGSFKPLAPIYREIIYVIHQIIDRMDNMVQLRKTYGSTMLEELSSKVHAYRRNVSGSSMLVLFSVHEALVTWQPLPQFIPSSRLAQLRLINRVRELIAARSGAQTPAGGAAPTVLDANSELTEQVAHLLTQKRSLSWNAAAAGQMEIIEYLEELMELVKLLVGVNAFRSGMLEKPHYSNYRSRIIDQRIPLAEDSMTTSSTVGLPTEANATAPGGQSVGAETTTTGLQRITSVREQSSQTREMMGSQRVAEAVASDSEEEEDLPMSLQRVGTRLWESNVAVRRRTNTMSTGNTR